MKRLLIAFLILKQCLSYSQSVETIIHSTIENIDKIKYVSYKSYRTASAPGDSISFHSYSSFFREVINPLDSFLGAKYLQYNSDTINVSSSYDGQVEITLDRENKSLRINDFKEEIESFRNANFSFFIRCKTILDYYQKDSFNTKLDYKFDKDTIILNFAFSKKIVEFVNIRPYISYNDTLSSRYQIFININSKLPMKFVRKMPHQTSWEIVENVKINSGTEPEIISRNIIPEGFSIKNAYNNEIETYNLVNKIASNFELENLKGDTIKLEMYKDKVVLLQFTGVGCGACHASIPFLKKISNDFNSNSFQLLSIESFSTNKEQLKRYIERNSINFPFLISNKLVTNEYLITGVPAFVLINKKGLIEKVFVGYQNGKTDNEIVEEIRKIL